MIWYYTVVTAF